MVRSLLVGALVWGLGLAFPPDAALAQTTSPLAVDVAPLREGIWILPDPDCRFDTGKPLARWPRCASWGLIRGGAWWAYVSERWENLSPLPPVEGQAWARTLFGLSPGERRILQLRTDRFEPGDYQFLALTVERRDAARRITAFAMSFPAPGRPFVWKPSVPSPSGFDPFPKDEAAACAAARDGCEDGEPYFDLPMAWVRDPRPDDFAR